MCWIFTSKGQTAPQPYIIEPVKFNNQLLQNTISGIEKDEAGMLWALTQYGCYRYDGFNTKTFVSSNTTFLNSDRYRALFQDNANKRLIAVGESDYFFIQDRALKKKANADSVLVLNNYNFLLTPRNRLKKILTENNSLISFTILFFKSDTLLIRDRTIFNLSKDAFVFNEELKALKNEQLIYRNGRHYMLKKTGLHELRWEGGKLTTKIITPLLGFNHIIPNNDEKSIWVENEVEVKKINLITGTIVTGFTKPTDVMFSQTLLEDETTGLIYLGTVKKGVLVIRANQVTQLIPENYTSSYTFNKKLNSYCVATSKGIAFWPKAKTQPTYLPQKDILNLYIFSDQQQRIWYQNTKAKILLLDPSNNKLIDSLPFDDFMASVKQLDSNRFIIANHNTVYKYDIKEKKREAIFSSRNTGVINDLCFFNNNMYVSTTNGLYILDGKHKITNHLLPGITLRKSIQLKNKTLAIGSYGKGLFLLKNGVLFAASTDKYPQLSAVVSLSLDADSALWVICNKAAFVWNNLDEKQGNVNAPDHVLAVETDLPCNELNGGLNPDKFPNHQIVLPSSDGLLLFNKADLIRKASNTPIAIASVAIGDREIENVSEFKVPAGSQPLKFTIDASNLALNATMESAYRIKELDSNWKSLPDNRTIEFLRLPRGDYHLEFRKNPADKAIILSSFRVQARWYETIWALVLFILTAFLLVYLIVKIRIRSQQQYQKKLEIIIEEKTKSLQENINKLNASEKELKRQHRYRNKLYSILMHDLKSPMTFLSTYSIQQLTKESPVEKESMRVIAKSSSELSSFINEFLFWLGNQTNPDKVSLKKTNVTELLDELVNFYQSFAAINNNKIFYFDKHKDIVFRTDADRLKIIVRNLLDNANKYMTNGIIKISCFQDAENNPVITIEDSGNGLPQNIADLINNPARPEANSLSINANHKMGLMISKELIDQIHGSIDVVSDEKTGTLFTIRFFSKNQKH